jgi:transposase
MYGILGRVRFSVKENLRKSLRRCPQADLRVRFLVILNLLNGRSAYKTAGVLGIHNTTVYRIARRFRQRGEWGLFDGREDNGASKLDEKYLRLLYEVVRSRPQAHGWRRPTWTRQMFVETLTRKTGIRIHVATMSRALAAVKARRGRPRPMVRCPWSAASKTRRLNAIRKLLAELPPRHVAVYEDEVDIHLNPKIGWDWMVRGQQKVVVTPGQNEKRYLAGALDARTGELFCVEGQRKNSALFIALLDTLVAQYSEAAVIHVVLDNYRIHSSNIVAAALQGYRGKIRLHFLPPYCPEENKIERLWEDLHANVTRNHHCPEIESLLQEIRDYLCYANHGLTTVYYRQAA